jgi:hypothetical protein
MLLPTLLFAALAQAAPQFGGNQGFTMLRFGCAQTSIDRIDPLVNPGQAPSPHMHQIAGGNAFNITMASTDISKLADCTTCGYSEDVSEINTGRSMRNDYTEGCCDSCRITGLPMYTSRHATERTSVCLKSPTGQSFSIHARSHTNISFRDLFNDKYTGKTTGGFVVYYVSGGKNQVTAFKPVSNPHSLEYNN